MDFIFNAPSYVVFGQGKRREVGSLLKKWARKGNVLVVCDETIVHCGLHEDVAASITAQGMQPVIFDRVQPEAPVEVVREGVAVAREYEVGAIVVIGGGSSIDTGKAIAMMLENEGDILDYCKAQESFIHRRKTALLVLPTTCGTGSEMTDGGVIYDRESAYKYGFWDAFAGPDIAVIDPFMIEKMPASLLAATGMDALSHCIEAVTNRNTNPMSDALGLEAIRMIAHNLPIAYADRGNMESLEQVFAASSMAGMSFNRTGIHVGHSAAQALGAVAHLPHGITCAIFLPYVIISQVQAIPERIALIGKQMGLSIGEDAQPEQIGALVGGRIRALNDILKIPSLRKLGVDPGIFDHVADYALNEPFQASAPIPATRESLRTYWDTLLD